MHSACLHCDRQGRGGTPTLLNAALLKGRCCWGGVWATGPWGGDREFAITGYTINRFASYPGTYIVANSRFLARLAASSSSRAAAAEDRPRGERTDGLYTAQARLSRRKGAGREGERSGSRRAASAMSFFADQSLSVNQHRYAPCTSPLYFFSYHELLLLFLFPFFFLLCFLLPLGLSTF